MKTVGVTDLYEAAYLVLNGCAVAEVECIPLANVLGCRLSFASCEDLDYFQEQFQSRDASVNLYKFRSAYNQVNGYVHQAKKNYDRSHRGCATGGGVAGGDE